MTTMHRQGSQLEETRGAGVPSYFSQLTLHEFRNYRHMSLQFGPNPVVFFGPNGAGKTNLLEALSLFSTGSGFRGVKLRDLGYQDTAEGINAHHNAWALHVMIGDDLSLATGVSSDPARTQRICKIQGKVVRSSALFHDYVHLLHVTPDMDHLFTASSSDRRHFVDQLVSTAEPAHKTHLAFYEKAMKQRLSLLKQDKPWDSTWLGSLEKVMAERGAVIVQAREKMVRSLLKGEEQLVKTFPRFDCQMVGDMEELLKQTPEEGIEFIRERLKKNRDLDAAAGMTFFGPHRSDFSVLHRANNRPARECSTGEQKVLLLSIILAFIDQREPDQPFLALLLDDVIARLDLQTRMVLFDQVEQLQRVSERGVGVQTFFSGTDYEPFSPLKQAQFFEIQQGTVEADFWAA